MIVSFKFYLINFVDFVIDCNSHITSHVFQAFASCTHYTSYSLLNIVHVIVCVYGLTNHVLHILWILCKIDLMLEIFDISIDEQDFGFLGIIHFIFRSLSLFSSQILVCATGFCSSISLFIWLHIHHNIWSFWIITSHCEIDAWNFWHFNWWARLWLFGHHTFYF